MLLYCPFKINQTNKQQNQCLQKSAGFIYIYDSEKTKKTLEIQLFYDFHPSIHPSFAALSEHRLPDLPSLSRLLCLFHPFWVSLGSPSGGTYPKHLHREASTGPEPPQLALLHVEEQRLYFKLLSGGKTSHSVLKGDPRVLLPALDPRVQGT